MRGQAMVVTLGHVCRAAARNLELLTRLGVTHVLNTAEGVGIR